MGEHESADFCGQELKLGSLARRGMGESRGWPLAGGVWGGSHFPTGWKASGCPEGGNPLAGPGQSLGSNTKGRNRFQSRPWFKAGLVLPESLGQCPNAQIDLHVGVEAADGAHVTEGLACPVQAVGVLHSTAQQVLRDAIGEAPKIPACILGAAGVEQLLGSDRGGGRVAVTQGQCLGGKLPRGGVTQGGVAELGHAVSQLGQLRQDGKRGRDDLIQFLAGVADVNRWNQAVGDHQAVLANEAEHAGVNLVAAAAVVGIEQDNLGGEFVQFGDHVAALEANHVHLESPADFQARAGLFGFDGFPTFGAHGFDDAVGGEERVFAGNSRHGGLGENAGRGGVQFGIRDFGGVDAAAVGVFNDGHNLNLSCLLFGA